MAQGRDAEAESLYDRCQAIQEKVLGPDDPELATTLNNRAWLFESQASVVKTFLEVRCP